MTHLPHHLIRRRIAPVVGVGLVLAATFGCTAPTGRPTTAAASMSTPVPSDRGGSSPASPVTSPSRDRSAPAVVGATTVSATPTEIDQVAGQATGPACTPAAVQATVVHFVTAFNAGDTATLQRLWARTDQGFVWYLDGRQSATTRATLGAFLSARHAHHEVLRLTSFQFTGYGDQGGANFYITLTRSTDGRPGVPGWGKGVVNCATNPLTFTVLAV